MVSCNYLFLELYHRGFGPAFRVPIGGRGTKKCTVSFGIPLLPVQCSSMHDEVGRGMCVKKLFMSGKSAILRFQRKIPFARASTVQNEYEVYIYIPQYTGKGMELWKKGKRLEVSAKLCSRVVNQWLGWAKQRGDQFAVSKSL